MRRALCTLCTGRTLMNGKNLQRKKHPQGVLFSLEAPPGIGPGIRILQTLALPLGYGAEFEILFQAGTRGRSCLKWSE